MIDPIGLDIFKLTKQETRILFSLEDWLVRLDIKHTSDESLASRKTGWLQEWEKGIFSRSFFGLVGENPPKSESEVVKKINTIKDHSKKVLIFCEAMVFAPYYNIQHRESSHLKETIDEANREAWHKNLFRLAESVEVSTELLSKWEERYSLALKSIGGRSEVWKKAAWVALASVAIAVTGGVAAPAIGGFVGGFMGLSGAAATSAGLAFLGGGAIAAGGFGMAGGTIALIGGGALLGGAGGLVASRVFYLQNKAVLTQLAKLEASLTVVFGDQPDIADTLKNVTENLILVLGELTNEINSESLNESEKKALAKTAEYYKQSINRLNDERMKRIGLR